MYEASKVMDLRECPKCGGGTVRVVFSEGKKGGSCVVAGGGFTCLIEGEHLHLTCSCEHKWTTGCLDAD